MKRTLRFWGLAAATVLAAGVITPGTAMAESTKKRVERLEGQVSELQAAARGSINSAERVDRLEADVRRLTGEVERLSFELEQATARLNSISAVLAGDTLGSAQPALGPGGAPATLGGPETLGGPQTLGGPVDLATGAETGAPAATQTAPTDIELPFDPNAAFEYADNFLLQSDYARAGQAFALFLESFPGHPRAADAQFRLGEIYLSTGDNPGAADAFIAYIQNYPNDPRAAEAYVKLGSAFGRMGRTGEACQVLRTMKKDFPGASLEVMNRADRELARSQCT